MVELKQQLWMKEVPPKLITPAVAPAVLGRSRLPLLTDRSPLPIVCVPAKVLAAPSWGTTEVLMLSVPAPMIGPPVRPKPDPTLVTVPPPPPPPPHAEAVVVS